MSFARNALNARTVGSGTDVLVLIHGMGCDQTVWDSYLPWLSQRYRVITYDLPFAGSADRSFFDLTRHDAVEGHAQDLLEILKDFSVTRCSAIGHSVGALIALFAAIERPEIFERLILIGASACYLNEPGYQGGFDEPALLEMFEAVAKNFRGWAESFTPAMIGKPLEDPAAQTFLASMLNTRPDIAIAVMQPILFRDYRAEVRQCRVPAILLQTEHDAAVPMDAALGLQRCLPGSILEIIKTAGHLPHLSAPEAIASAFRRHLPKLSSAPRAPSRV